MLNEQIARDSTEPREVSKTVKLEFGPLEVSVSVSVQGIGSNEVFSISSPDPTGPPTEHGSKGDSLGRA